MIEKDIEELKIQLKMLIKKVTALSEQKVIVECCNCNKENIFFDYVKSETDSIQSIENFIYQKLKKDGWELENFHYFEENISNIFDSWMCKDCFINMKSY